MEISVRVDERPDELDMFSEEITITGRPLTIHYSDGAIEEAFDKAGKFDQIKEIMDDTTIDHIDKFGKIGEILWV